MVMTQVVPEQNVSCAAPSAAPPGVRVPMSCLVLSDRRTWYSRPEWAPYSARTVLWAATHGVPAAAKMSHGAAIDMPPPLLELPLLLDALPLLLPLLLLVLPLLLLLLYVLPLLPLLLLLALPLLLLERPPLLLVDPLLLLAPPLLLL